MGVKVEIHGMNRGANFPLLMHDPDTGLVLFMEAASQGMVLRGGTTRLLPGYYGTNWTMNKLTRFDGRVTLENN